MIYWNQKYFMLERKTPKFGIGVQAFKSYKELEPFAQIIESMQKVEDQFKKSYWEVLGSKEKKIWGLMGTAYTSATAFYCYEIFPLIHDLIAANEMAIAIQVFAISLFIIFGAIPLIVTTLSSTLSTMLEKTQTPPPPLPEKDLPHITITVPTLIDAEDPEILFKTSLKSCLAADYPKEKLHILVIANGHSEKEGNREKINKLKQFCEQNGFEFIFREGKEGGKSRNLNITLGLKEFEKGKNYTPKSDLFFQIDSDIEFPPELLKKSIPEFQNPKLPFMVYEVDDLGNSNLFQKSLATMNRARSSIVHTTEEIGFTTSGGYTICYRKEAAEEIGGWPEDHVGEDWAWGIMLRTNTDWESGKRISYTKVIDRSPPTLKDYGIQQKRWAKGGIESILKLMKSFTEAEHIPWNEKADMIYRFTSYPFVSYTTVILPLILASTSIAGPFLGSDMEKMKLTSQEIIKHGSNAAGFGLAIVTSLLLIVKDIKIKQALESLLMFFTASAAMTATGPKILEGVMEGFYDKKKIFHVTPKGNLELDNKFKKIIQVHYGKIIAGSILIGLSQYTEAMQAIHFMDGSLMDRRPLFGIDSHGENKARKFPRRERINAAKIKICSLLHFYAVSMSADKN